jgi:hypothetical protein
VLHVTNWRGHLRVIAIVANALMVLFLVGSRGWFMSMAFGVPMIVPPALAIAALVLQRR